jgi:hypothetical protein
MTHLSPWAFRDLKNRINGIYRSFSMWNFPPRVKECLLLNHLFSTKHKMFLVIV